MTRYENTVYQDEFLTHGIWFYASSVGFIIKACLSRRDIEKKNGFCVFIDVKYFHSKCSFSFTL